MTTPGREEGSEAISWNISLSACQAALQSRPRSLGWYLKMGRRSLGMVKANCAWLTCSRMCASSRPAKSRTRFCWHEAQNSLHLQEYARIVRKQQPPQTRRAKPR